LAVRTGGSAAQRCEAFLPALLAALEDWPHGGRHWFRPVQQTGMQRVPVGQSLELSQSLLPVQLTSEAQKQAASVVWEQKQSPLPSFPQTASGLLQKTGSQGSAQLLD
jgi:hypothetical protein